MIFVNLSSNIKQTFWRGTLHYIATFHFKSSYYSLLSIFCSNLLLLCQHFSFTFVFLLFSGKINSGLYSYPPYSWFSRYLNSAKGNFQDFTFVNGSAKMGDYLEQLFFQGLNFTNNQPPEIRGIYVLSRN